MANDYYVHGGFPAQSSPGASASMRSELDTITAGFDKLAPLSGNATKFIRINDAGNAQTVSTTLSETGGNLTITGSTTLTRIILAAGLVGTPSLTIAGSLTTGLYSPAADQLAVSIAGVQALLIGSGRNIIIPAPNTGTTLALTAASGQFAFTIDSAASQQSLHVIHVGGTQRALFGVAGAAAQIITDSAANDLAVRTQGGAIRFSVNSGASSAMVIGSSGNVAIATPSSGTSLTITTLGTAIQLLSGAATALALNFNQTGQVGWTLYQPASSNDFRFNNGTDKFFIDSSGNVGIGGAASGVKAEVFGTMRLNSDLIVRDGVGGDARFGYQAFSANSAWNLWSQSNVPLTLGANSTERLRISGAGVITESTTGFELGYKDIPRTTGGIARGQAFATSAGFTLNTGTAAGGAYSVYNDSAAAITVTQGAGLTLRLAGTTTTGNRTIAARGFATIWFNSTTEAAMSGAGVT